jgi:hypothetical protein
MVFSVDDASNVGYGQFTSANVAFSPHQHRNGDGLYSYS